MRGHAGREAQVAEHHVLHPVTHVRLAEGVALHRLLARRGAAAPRRRGPRATRARSRRRAPCRDSAGSRRCSARRPGPPQSTSSFSRTRPGWYSSRWPTISVRPLSAAAATTLSASATDWASGFSTNTCLPASSTRRASSRVRGHGRGHHHGVEVRVGEQLVDRRVGAGAGNDVAPRRSSAARRRRRRPRRSWASGSAAKLRARFGPPVAEPHHPHRRRSRRGPRAAGLHHGGRPARAVSCGPHRQRHVRRAPARRSRAAPRRAYCAHRRLAVGGRAVVAARADPALAERGGQLVRTARSAPRRGGRRARRPRSAAAASHELADPGPLVRRRRPRGGAAFQPSSSGSSTPQHGGLDRVEARVVAHVGVRLLVARAVEAQRPRALGDLVASPWRSRRRRPGRAGSSTGRS